jgi:hypothetical protein
MPWVRFSDDWYDDDELSDAHPLSVLLWATAISWSARNLKDGKIPAGRVDMLVNWRRAGVPDPQLHVDELVTLGKWTAVPTGFLISNYHLYQPTRAAVLASREKDRKRKGSKEPPDGIQPESAQDPLCPVPGPVPEGPPSSSVDVLGTCPQVTDDVWIEYARLKRATCKETVRNITSYDRRTIENAKTEHGDLAARWWATFDISPAQLAAGLVSGNPGPYWDRRRESA